MNIYQCPPNQWGIELTGRSIKHIEPRPAKDIQQFRNVHIKKYPDSRRIIQPQLAVKDNIY